MKVETGSEVVPRSEVGLVLHWCKRRVSWEDALVALVALEGWQN